MTLVYNKRNKKMKKILILLFAVTVFAQQNEKSLTGVLSIDSKMAGLNMPAMELAVDDAAPAKKSVLLAGVLSFAVPGAGEFYSESYIKSAAFFLAEVGFVSLGLIYDKKGDDQTNLFENFANSHWSVQQYAEWTLNRFNGTVNSEGTTISPENYPGLVTNNQVNWHVLNKLEDDVSRSDAGRYYSHKLAPYGDQQYYEMIGKYTQFNVGWDDFPADGDYSYGQPVTAKFNSYSDMRGKANDYYNVASTAVKIIVVNHILSAIDAIWSASRYNKTVTASVSMKKTNIGFVIDVHPELHLAVRF